MYKSAIKNMPNQATAMQTLQLFDPASSTYTYLLWCTASLDAIIIDPLDTHMARDFAALQQHGLRLRYVVETHAHADHITSAGALVKLTGAQAATPAGCGMHPAALQLQDGDVLQFGSQQLKALHTPGHTAGSMSFVWTGPAHAGSLPSSQVFTGDTLLIGGCGRTDFQSGSPQALYRSITQILFALPDATVVWPGHDYQGRTSSTIGHEKQHNLRTNAPELGRLRTAEEFTALMNNLNLPKPARIDEAVPANLTLGQRHDAGAQAKDETLRPVSASARYSGDIPPLLAHRWWREGNAHLVDIRTHAERAWVGFIPDVPAVEFKIWPGMALNPDFDAQLQAAVPAGAKVLLLCRSGIRSIPAAQRAQALGFEAYNILEGFEGDPDRQAHRSTLGGWRKLGLPWSQN
jgi:glyoxylase-like metal-dependent hydrolase (beta-lactamase superfamily II)/rhodanese-related sulfurtransferase